MRKKKSITINEELLKELEQAAENENSSVSRIIENRLLQKTFWVLVGVYEGLNDEVSLHRTEGGAEKAFLEYTKGLTLKKLEELEEQNPETEYGCTRIFEVKLEN